MEKLPEDLNMEILVRLSVKSLVRLKCVSKSFFSLISNPSFAELHFQRSSSQQQHTHRFLYTTPSQIRSIDITNYDDSSASVKLRFPLHHQPHTDFHILGSCRGLLLLSLTNKEQELFLWNPSTGFFKQIPFPPNTLRLVRKFVVPGSFCYDELTHDYLFLLAICCFCSITGFEVFSLRTSSCEKLPLINYHYPITGPLHLPSCSVLNGAFHLLLPSNPKFPYEARIIAFNRTRKNIVRQVAMPSSDDIYSLLCCKLGVFAGCLTLTDSKVNDETKVWVMRQHGEKSSSWSKLFSSSHHKDISPLCFNRDGEIVAKDGRLGLSKWSDKGELLENRPYCDLYEFWRPTILYTETLVSVP